ncbi:MAG: DUF2807 domain-containing protein [Flavobacterium sp.]|nr:DUF2807 domain-containing protein [Flavobacterium sp.]
MVIFCASCGLSDECIKSSGTRQMRDVEVGAFENIYVYPGIALVVTQGDQYEVKVEAGENFIDQISVEVDGNSLILKDETGCNWVRDYGQTIVHVTAPNLVEIYSNTEQTIRSNGVLSYPMLRLYSMDFFGGVGTGDFHIEVDNNQLVVQSNHVSAFHITGSTQQLLLSFYNGNGRFEGADFLANEIIVFHRGANDMIIHPVETLSGDIYGTGNVISVTQPPNVNVTQHYTGTLIFD